MSPRSSAFGPRSARHEFTKFITLFDFAVLSSLRSQSGEVLCCCCHIASVSRFRSAKKACAYPICKQQGPLGQRPLPILVPTKSESISHAEARRPHVHTSTRQWQKAAPVPMTLPGRRVLATTGTRLQKTSRGGRPVTIALPGRRVFFVVYEAIGRKARKQGHGPGEVDQVISPAAPASPRTIRLQADCLFLFYALDRPPEGNAVVCPWTLRRLDLW